MRHGSAAVWLAHAVCFFVALVYIVFHLLLLSCVDCTVYIEKYGTQIRTFVYRSAFILCFTFSLR